jgi:hypothetical protein
MTPSPVSLLFWFVDPSRNLGINLKQNTPRTHSAVSAMVRLNKGDHGS